MLQMLLTSPHFAAAEPGLDEAALLAFEAALAANLPDEARTMYRVMGGISDRVCTALPMRLLPPADALDTLHILTDGAETYRPHPAVRYLFTDDNSNWAGVFVEGPLRGKLTLLDHDLCSSAPRFASLTSFIAKLLAAADRGEPWEQMPTDFPMSSTSEGALLDEAIPLAAYFLERYHAATEAIERTMAADIALHLSDPRHGDTVEQLLADPSPFTRQTALQVAAIHRRAALAPVLEAVAYRAFQQNQYGTWSNALKALAPLGISPAFEALVAAAPPNWPPPIRRQAPRQ